MISTAVIVGDISATDWASSGGNPRACGRSRGADSCELPAGSPAAVPVLITGGPPCCICVKTRSPAAPGTKVEVTRALSPCVWTGGQGQVPRAGQIDAACPGTRFACHLQHDIV